MIRLNAQLREQLYTEAEACYPMECCGILLGRMEADGARLVKQLWPVENTACKSQRQNHFMITSEAIMEAERSAASGGYEIIGFYHSHNDCQAVPSELDAAYVIPGLSYPIISVMEGRAVGVRSWVVDASNQEECFGEEIIKIKKEGK